MIRVGQTFDITAGTKSRARIAVLDEGGERIFCFDENGLPRPRESVRLPGGLPAPDSFLNNNKEVRLVGGSAGWMTPTAAPDGSLLLTHFDGGGNLSFYSLANGSISPVSVASAGAQGQQGGGLFRRVNLPVNSSGTFNGLCGYGLGNELWVRRNDAFIRVADIAAFPANPAELAWTGAVAGATDMVCVGVDTGKPVFLFNTVDGTAMAEFDAQFELTALRYPKLIVASENDEGFANRSGDAYGVFNEDANIRDSVFGNLAFARDTTTAMDIARPEDVLSLLNGRRFYVIGYVRGKARLFAGGFAHIAGTSVSIVNQSLFAIARIPTRNPDCIYCSYQTDAPEGVSVTASLKVTTMGMHSFRDVIGEAAGNTANISRRFLSEARVSISGIMKAKGGGIAELGDYWGFRHDGKNYICVNARELAEGVIAATFQEDVV